MRRYGSASLSANILIMSASAPTGPRLELDPPFHDNISPTESANRSRSTREDYDFSTPAPEPDTPSDTSCSSTRSRSSMATFRRGHTVKATSLRPLPDGSVSYSNSDAGFRPPKPANCPLLRMSCWHPGCSAVCGPVQRRGAASSRI